MELLPTGFSGNGWYVLQGEKFFVIEMVGEIFLWHLNPCGWQKLTKEEIKNLVKESYDY